MLSSTRIRLGVLSLAVIALVPVGAAELGKLESRLKQAAKKGDAGLEALRATVSELVEDGSPGAVKVLLKLIPKMQRAGDATYWTMLNGAASFQGPEALTEVGNFVVGAKKTPVARDLLFSLENNPSPYTTKVLGPVLEKGTYDLQLMAADQLGHVASRDSADALIEALKREGDKGDPALLRRIYGALTILTGENMGTADNWIGWWEVNREKGLPEPSEQKETGAFASSTLKSDREKDFASVTEQVPSRVLVISSKLPDDHPKEPNHDYNYDHMEQVLQGMNIPHEVVLKDDFERDPRKYLDGAWSILVNCNNIQKQCICEACRRAVNGGGPTKNRLLTCPPDCPQGHDEVTYRLSASTVDMLKAWVDDGGYLFTEDWGLVEIIEIAWPEMVRPKSSGNDGDYHLVRPAQEVPIRPGRGMASRPILRGVFTRPRPPAREPDGEDGEGGTRTRPVPDTEPMPLQIDHRWMIDDESPSIELVDSRNVTVLMQSEELGRVAGGNDSVAVTWRAGRGKGAPKAGGGTRTGGDRGKSRGKGAWGEQLRGGRVLHVISHFGKQQGNQSDTFVLQNLILNFLMESNRQHGG